MKNKLILASAIILAFSSATTANALNPSEWDIETEADQCVSVALFKKANEKLNESPGAKEIFIGAREMTGIKNACIKSTGKNRFERWKNESTLRLRY